jgi:hypothetical protein
MPILLRNLRLNLDEPEEALILRAAKKLGVGPDAIRAYSVVHRSLDARKKRDIHFSYHVELALEGADQTEPRAMKKLPANQAAWIKPQPPHEPRPGRDDLPERPVVVGFGPGGMFAALRLARAGYRPIVLERGRDIRRRHRDVMHRFYRERDFDPTSNLLYGEGGAGTYSDGKLYTRISDPRARTVLEEFFRHGASGDILIDARPHIGSDKLPTICTRIRGRIESLGGEVRFEHTLRDIRLTRGRVDAIQVHDGATDRASWMRCGPVILAAGHSARDTVRMLIERGVEVVPKPFQIGVRIEHPQELVNRWQYGDSAGHRRLGPAEYHLVAKGVCATEGGDPAGDLFSFCMCPGGMILPTNESPGLIATNGASRASRSGPFANSGLVVTMDPALMNLDAPGAIAYVEQWERKAFAATGGTYRIPAQRGDDYLAGRASDGSLETSYPLGGQWTSIRELIPSAAADALARGLVILSRKFPGFAGPDAIVTAPETRASAPFRILRDARTFEAPGAAGLFPVGEGAGYAGGIISAAVDGIKAADLIIERYAPPR